MPNGSYRGKVAEACRGEDGEAVVDAVSLRAAGVLREVRRGADFGDERDYCFAMGKQKSRESAEQAHRLLLFVRGGRPRQDARWTAEKVPKASAGTAAWTDRR